MTVSKTARRVGIVHSEPNLDSIPCLCVLIEMLAKIGISVDVFTHAAEGFLAPSFSSPNIRVHLPQPRSQRKGLGRWLPRRHSIPLQIAQWHARHPFDCLIGVDSIGLLEAHNLTRWIRVPIGYLSLELLLSHEAKESSRWSTGNELTFRRAYENKNELWLKEQERRLLTKTDFVIIQDRERGELFVKDNPINWNKIVKFPNAPHGPARVNRRSYWHKRFNLPTNTRIVLQAGSVGTWTGAADIVASASSWPDDWVLVVHTRYSASAKASNEIEHLQKIAPANRVFFSFDPVGRNEYDELIDSSDIGIAFYLPDESSRFLQSNIRTIGLSSGKIAYSLRSGVPVIVNQVPSIARQTTEHGFGVAVSLADEITGAIQQIARDYEKFSQSALHFFKTELDPEKHFPGILSRICPSMVGEGRR
jgi:glycosyltransferase involved in cell wall biosynthesis